MFNRVKYKKMAREQIKGNWSVSLLMTCLFMSIFLILNFSLKVMERNNSSFRFIFSLVNFAIYGIYTIVLAYSYLKLSRTNRLEKTDLFDSLSDYWLKGILGIFWSYIWTLLWSMLFVIPGIVKAFAYSQMFFVMAENEKVSVTKSMNLSKILTNGHKADLFMMALSFLPWILLSCITFGIGFIFLIPYMTLSFANAYTDLKIEALKSSKLDVADFE